MKLEQFLNDSDKKNLDRKVAESLALNEYYDILKNFDLGILDSERAVGEVEKLNELTKKHGILFKGDTTYFMTMDEEYGEFDASLDDIGGELS